MSSESALARSRSVDKCSAHLQGRLLANWEEFREFRKEAQSRLEELFELSQRVRKSEKSAQIHAGQLDVRVDRCLQRIQEVQSRYESNDSKFHALAKAVEGAKEASEGVKKKQQQLSAEQQTSLETMRHELTDQGDKHHRSLLDTIRRGDRSVADEILRKMAELNEKLGSNMQSLEDEVALDLQQMNGQLADLSSHQQKDREALSSSVESLESFVRRSVAAAKDEVSVRVSDVHSQLSDAVQRNAASADREVRDQHTQMQALEARMTEGFEAAHHSLSAWKEAEAATAESLRVQIQEVAKETREDRQRAEDTLNSKIKELSAKFQSELSSGLAKCQNGTQELRDDFQTGTEETRQQVRTVCQEMFEMVTEVHRQIQACESNISDLLHQNKESEKKLQEGASRSDQRFREFEDWARVRLGDVSQELRDLEDLTKQTSSESKKQCREWVDEAIQAQERVSEIHGKAMDKIREDVTLDIQEVKLNFEELVHSASSRSEVSIKEVRKEAETWVGNTDRKLDDLAACCTEKWSEVERWLSAQQAQNQQHEELEKRTSALELQLNESIAQIREKLSEALGGCRASKRAEEDLESRCEKLHKALYDLGNSLEDVKRRSTQSAEKFQEYRAELRTEFFEKEQQGKAAVEDVRRQAQQRIDAAVTEASTRLNCRIDKGQELAVEAAREVKEHCNSRIQELHDMVDAHSSEWRRQMDVNMAETHRSVVMLRDVQWQVERDLQGTRDSGEKQHQDHLGSGSKLNTQTGSRSPSIEASWRPRYTNPLSLSDGASDGALGSRFDPEASATSGLFQEMVRSIADVHKQVSQVREESTGGLQALRRSFEKLTLAHDVEKLQGSLETFASEIREELHDSAIRVSKECKAESRRTYRELVDESQVDQAESLLGIREDFRKELHEKTSETHLFCEKSAEEAKRSCRELIDEALKIQERSQRMHDKAREEDNCWSQSALVALEDRLQAGVSRSESLAQETQRQTRLWADETARQVEDLALRVKEKCAELGRDTKRLQEQFQEIQQDGNTKYASVERQVADSMLQLREKVGEAIASCKASKRSEAELEARCDKFQKADVEFAASIEDLRRKVNGVSLKFQESRGELRGELRSDVFELEKREKQVLDEAQKQWQARLDASLAEVTSRLGSRMDRVQDSSADVSRELTDLSQHVDAQTRDLRREMTQKLTELQHTHTVKSSLASTRSPRTDMGADRDLKTSHLSESTGGYPVRGVQENRVDSRPQSPERDSTRHRPTSSEAPWRLGPDPLTHGGF